MATLYKVEESDVICAGASARALAFSCLRAGLRPVSCDLFYDSDLAARCPGVKIASSSWPEDILSTLERLPPLPVIYSGGLENHPELVRRLQDRHEIIGNDAEVLERALDPFVLSRCLTAAGLRVPEIRRAGDGSSGEDDWLSKPTRGGGGIGIETASQVKNREGHYLQRFIDGAPASALFLAGENDPARSLLLGATEQLIGESWLGATGFTWCGNLGPLELDEETHRQVELGGETVARELSLRGLFGLDFVLTDDGPVFIELNPRYTGSTEIIERCCEFDAIRHHLAACRDGELPPAAPDVSKSCGKAILFAEAPLELSALPDSEEDSGSSFADLPRPGEKIEIGSPVLTMLTDGEDLAKCRSVLERLAKDARSLLR